MAASNDTKVQIDKTSRIVVPAKLRKRLGLKRGDFISLTLERRGLYLAPLTEYCAICGEEATWRFGELHLCAHCKELCSGDGVRIPK